MEQPPVEDPLTENLINLYWTLGKLKTAEDSAQLVSNPARRQLFLMDIALDRDDRRCFKELLGTATPGEPSVAERMAEAGLIPEAQAQIWSAENRGSSSEQLRWARAQLALARGQTEKAIALYEEIARLNPATDDNPIPSSLFDLSRAYVQKGDIPKAIQLLEPSSKEKNWGAIGWLDSSGGLDEPAIGTDGAVPQGRSRGGRAENRSRIAEAARLRRRRPPHRPPAQAVPRDGAKRRAD